MIARIGRLARVVDSYANALLVFLLLVAVLAILTALTTACFGLYHLAGSIIYAALIVGVPPYLVLLARHINPEEENS